MRIVGALFARPLTRAGSLLLALSFSTFAFCITHYAAERQMASRAIERAQLLDDYMLTVDAAETGQRGFLLTGDASYLAPFLKASSDISLTFSALEARFAGSRVS